MFARPPLCWLEFKEDVCKIPFGWLRVEENICKASLCVGLELKKMFIRPEFACVS